MEHDTESRGNGLPRLKAEDPQGENDCVFFMFKDREPKVVREERLLFRFSSPSLALTGQPESERFPLVVCGSWTDSIPDWPHNSTYRLLAMPKTRYTR